MTNCKLLMTNKCTSCEFGDVGWFLVCSWNRMIVPTFKWEWVFILFLNDTSRVCYGLNMYRFEYWLLAHVNFLRVHKSKKRLNSPSWLAASHLSSQIDFIKHFFKLILNLASFPSNIRVLDLTGWDKINTSFKDWYLCLFLWLQIDELRRYHALSQFRSRLHHFRRGSNTFGCLLFRFRAQNADVDTLNFFALKNWFSL